MPNGIVIIDKPAGWTSMDVCNSPKTALPFPGPPFHFTCAAELNSALRQDFALRPKYLYGACAPVLGAGEVL